MQKGHISCHVECCEGSQCKQLSGNAVTMKEHLLSPITLYAHKLINPFLKSEEARINKEVVCSFPSQEPALQTCSAAMAPALNHCFPVHPKGHSTQETCFSVQLGVFAAATHRCPVADECRQGQLRMEQGSPAKGRLYSMLLCFLPPGGISTDRRLGTKIRLLPRKGRLCRAVSLLEASHRMKAW